MSIGKKKLITIKQKELLEDGQHLIDWLMNQPADGFSDYSFLVAPFAKAYEGILKRFFLKLDLITDNQYRSDRFRVGKVLNPALRNKKWSVYRRLEETVPNGREIADQLWLAWKKGRNLIFHYFPHNLHKLTFDQAIERIEEIKTSINQTKKITR